MMESYYGRGKLLLFGEYAVLDGALALAVPSRYGQHLRVWESREEGVSWRSLDEKGSCWFETHFSLQEVFAAPETGPFPGDLRARLLRILRTARELGAGFLKQPCALRVETRLEFPREWGLGTSSTLLSCIAQWSGANPYELSNHTLGGSGYDLACATATGPVMYQRKKSGNPLIRTAGFAPEFADSLRLVYLGKKQDSREGIARYRKAHGDKKALVRELSDLSQAMATTSELPSFMEGMLRSESLLSDFLGIPQVGDSRFPDFRGCIKSLGAWGGDFILAAAEEDSSEYFRKKGFGTQFGFRELLLV